MKKVIYLIVIIVSMFMFLRPSYALGYDPADVKVLLNGNELSFDQEPVIIGGRVLVPLRRICETLGITVTWTEASLQISLSKGDTSIGLNLDSDKGFTSGREAFFLDHPPILVYGRTMVPLRFIAEALGVKIDWDAKNRVISISGNVSSGFFQNGSSSSGNDYYKLYETTVGPSKGPSSDEAKDYVLKNGLLKAIKDVQPSPYRFYDEEGSTATMVTGDDDSGKEKAVWLTKTSYAAVDGSGSLDVISVNGSVYLKDGLSQDDIYTLLLKEGIARESVENIYLAPLEQESN